MLEPFNHSREDVEVKWICFVSKSLLVGGGSFFRLVFRGGRGTGSRSIFLKQRNTDLHHRELADLWSVPIFKFVPFQDCIFTSTMTSEAVFISLITTQILTFQTRTSVVDFSLSMAPLLWLERLLFAPEIFIVD